MNHNEFQEKHQELYRALKEYLNGKQFLYYLEDSVPKRIAVKPDIVGEENDEEIFYEIKVGEHINFYRVLNQLNKFIKEGNFKRGYLVVSNNVNISNRIKNLYIEQGFGILKIDTEKETPKTRKILDSDDHTKKSREYIEYSEDKNEWVEKHSVSLSYLREILIFIICGEFLVTALWELFSTQNLGYLWIVIPTAIILIAIFYFIYYRENRKD